MEIQFWMVSGYEAVGEIDEKPAEGTVLHQGRNVATGERIWVYRDETLRRWQEIDPDIHKSGKVVTDHAQLAPE